MSKTIKSRIIHKHDIEANWLLATNFTPMNGEIIIYDEDENYSHKRIKIGDGETNVNQLPFLKDKSLEEAIDEVSENSKVFYVTVTMTDENYGTPDKTLTEINEAYTNRTHTAITSGREFTIETINNTTNDTIAKTTITPTALKVTLGEGIGKGIYDYYVGKGYETGSQIYLYNNSQSDNIIKHIDKRLTDLGFKKGYIVANLKGNKELGQKVIGYIALLGKICYGVIYEFPTNHVDYDYIYNIGFYKCNNITDELPSASSVVSDDNKFHVPGPYQPFNVVFQNSFNRHKLSFSKNKDNELQIEITESIKNWSNNDKVIEEVVFGYSWEKQYSLPFGTLNTDWE